MAGNTTDVILAKRLLEKTNSDFFAKPSCPASARQDGCGKLPVFFILLIYNGVMAFTDFKISIEKSWDFTRQAAILIILGVVVIFGVLVLVWYLLKVPPPLQPELIEVTVPPRTEEEMKKQPPELRVPAIGIEIEEEE